MQKNCQRSCRPQPKGVNSFYLLSELLSGTAVLTNQSVRTFARDFPGAGLTITARSELACSPSSHFLGLVATTKQDGVRVGEMWGGVGGVASVPRSWCYALWMWCLLLQQSWGVGKFLGSLPAVGRLNLPWEFPLVGSEPGPGNHPPRRSWWGREIRTLGDSCLGRCLLTEATVVAWLLTFPTISCFIWLIPSLPCP